MKQSLIKKMCCPFDKEDLELKIFAKDTEENILEGILTCSHCKRYYPIAYGVPIMSPDEYRERNLETPLLERWESQLKESSIEGFRLLSS
jgi:uncharacterized protein